MCSAVHLINMLHARRAGNDTMKPKTDPCIYVGTQMSSDSPGPCFPLTN